MTNNYLLTFHSEKEYMKISNYDAPENLAIKVIDLSIPAFVLDVMRPLEQDYYSHISSHQLKSGAHRLSHRKVSFPLSAIWKFEDVSYENIVTLLHTIPIYLRDTRPQEIPCEDCIIDPLGAYYSNRKGGSPYIELYLTNIESYTQNDDQHFKWLFTIVLLHELAHAALDFYNHELNYHTVEKVHYSSEFDRWREESMTNAVSLRIISNFGNNDFYDYSKQFMESQPAEYALGVLMEDFEHWGFRSVFDEKKQGVDSVLQQEWLKYAKGNPCWAGLEGWNEILNSDVVYLFEGKYYISEEELVSAIVNKVLTDYENVNGTKMSFSTFSSLFPNINTGARMSYEPYDNVKEDTRYRYKIELQDGDYSLYCFWDTNSLHEFVTNVNVPLIEYKNY